MGRKLWTDKTKNVCLSEKIPLGTPLSMLIEPINKCNFRCVYCPTGNKKLLKIARRPVGCMDFDLFKKIVRDIQSFPDRLERISLYKDGEPFLNPYLLRMIKVLKNANVSKDISITSNGSLLDKGLAIKLIDSGLGSIRFSIVAMSSESYKKLTRTGYSYDRIRENIKLLYKLRQASRCHYPIIYAKIIDFGLSELEKQKFYEDFSAISDEASIDMPMNWDDSHGGDFTLGHKRYLKEALLSKRQVCPRPWYTMSINFNGKVSVCCVDWSHKTIIGDVNKENLIDIWHGSKMHNFRKMHAEMKRHENKVCKNCEYMNDLQYESNLDEMAKNNIESLLAGPLL